MQTIAEVCQNLSHHTHTYRHKQELNIRSAHTQEVEFPPYTLCCIA